LVEAAMSGFWNVQRPIHRSRLFLANVYIR
jgi:hypothetical protein